ncbi:hypothetical protein F5J12DRAFT_892070 [Pisolithus orientalis]|uniref:uncharacterized protein n=1 Tax=Pisolithus orientalis TaxID=936130 RepID=UPI002224FE7F|nr:uncharacterized protein F5J12DRAFT_892070 [Pisolithus orientalis]KAI6008926.1 hypothetical protein F5J12DRAFT_892070 [Pisolithus orientalis]
MSANHLPRLSQLISSLASAALVAKARCLLDDKEELWEEKVTWMHLWEQRTGEVHPLVKCGQVLGVDTRIDATDGPILAEANKAYEKWSVEETAAAACGGGDEDV